MWRAGADPAPGSRHAGVYLAAALATLATAALIPVSLAVFVIWPPPLEGTAQEWFAVFEDGRLLGLLSLDLVFLVIYALQLPVYLGLYAALHRAEESLALPGTALGLLAIAIYFPSNTAFEMNSLWDSYRAAASPEERAALLAAAEAMLATYQGTAFHVSYVLGSLAGIVLPVAMLRSRVFSPAAAWALLLGNAVGLGLYVPEVGVALSAGSGLLLLGWYVLATPRFFELARLARRTGDAQAAASSRR